MPLAFREINVLPAEEPGIDGPGPRPNHRQNRPKHRHREGSPCIAGMRKKPRTRDRNFSDSCQSSGYRGPQTNQKKHPRANDDHLQGDCRQCRCRQCKGRQNAGDREIKQRNRGKQPQEQKTYAWQTIGECRK